MNPKGVAISIQVCHSILAKISSLARSHNIGKKVGNDNRKKNKNRPQKLTKTRGVGGIGVRFNKYF